MSPRTSALPRLTPNRILAWADAHRAATGAWPAADLTPVTVGLPGLRWQWVNHAMRNGSRGLPGGDSLAASWPGSGAARTSAPGPPLPTFDKADHRPPPLPVGTHAEGKPFYKPAPVPAGTPGNLPPPAGK